MRLHAIVAALLAVTAIPVFGQASEDMRLKFDEAERRIVRLSPSAFPELPASIVRELQRRGCTIPQTANTEGRTNVIHGQFAARGRTDWVVLCSIEGTSSILVFWNGPEKDPAELARLQDRIFLQSIDRDRIGFSRQLGIAGRDFILEHYRAYGGPKPPPIDHEGINDAFVGKASEVWYFFGGKWLKLSGAD